MVTLGKILISLLLASASTQFVLAAGNHIILVEYGPFVDSLNDDESATTTEPLNQDDDQQTSNDDASAADEAGLGHMEEEIEIPNPNAQPPADQPNGRPRVRRMTAADNVQNMPGAGDVTNAELQNFVQELMNDDANGRFDNTEMAEGDGHPEDNNDEGTSADSPNILPGVHPSNSTAFRSEFRRENSTGAENASGWLEWTKCGSGFSDHGSSLDR